MDSEGAAYLGTVAVKYVLSLFAALCFVSLLSLGFRYRLTCLYLLVCIPATLAFRVESSWLHTWYGILAGPVAILRLVAGVEVLHRQTEGFRYWWRLTGSAFILAGAFAALAWVQSAHPNVLQSFVEFRRLLQIWLAGLFLVVELFWISQGGGWYRRCDHLAVLFGLLAMNHGVVSVLSQVRPWGNGWGSASGWSAGIDAGVYLLMALRCRAVPSARLYPQSWT